MSCVPFVIEHPILKRVLQHRAWESSDSAGCKSQTESNVLKGSTLAEGSEWRAAAAWGRGQDEPATFRGRRASSKAAVGHASSPTRPPAVVALTTHTRPLKFGEEQVAQPCRLFLTLGIKHSKRRIYHVVEVLAEALVAISSPHCVRWADHGSMCSLR